MSEYYASPTCSKFHADDNFVRLIMGPIGSGKSVASIMELMTKAHGQAPNKSGVRKTRWAIIRNTYRELIDTTMKSWFDWFPEELGLLKKQDMTWILKGTLDDGTKIEAEFMFRALDKPNDVKKLLSLELTGAFINESREVPKEILDMLMGRVGRFPSKRDGGPTWYGVILDTNPPDSDHWMYGLFEENIPDNYSIFHQPSGLSDEAENVENLPDEYYTNMQAGKDQEWINVYVHGRYGFITEGKPVYPEYNDDIHHTDDQPIISDTDTIYVGIDFGLTPAAAIGRETPSGQFQIIDELVTFDMGAVSFGRLLKEKIHKQYPNNPIEIYGDPAGEQRAQTDEVTPFMILNNLGLVAFPTYTNDATIRREVVADLLQRLDFSGQPAFTVCPAANMTRKAFAGGYKYKRLQVSGEQRFVDKPDKGKYSHISDAVQYLVLGALGGDRVIGGYGKQEIDYSQTEKGIV